MRGLGRYLRWLSTLDLMYPSIPSAIVGMGTALIVSGFGFAAYDAVLDR